MEFKNWNKVEFWSETHLVKHHMGFAILLEMGYFVTLVNEPVGLSQRV